MTLSMQDLLDFIFFLGIPETEATENKFFAENLGRWDSGARKEAIADLNEVIEKDPDNELARVGRCFYRMQLGDGIEALEDYSHVMNLRVPDGDSYYYRASVRLTYLGDREGALKDYEQAVALDTESVRARSALRSVRKSLWIEDDSDEFLENVVHDPHDPWPYVDFFGGTEAELRLQIAELSKALRLRPDFFLALQSRSLCKMFLGDLEGALTDASRAVEAEPLSPYGCAVRARRRMDLEDYAGALSDLERAIELDPEDGEYYHIRARVKAIHRDFEGADRDDAMSSMCTKKTAIL